MSSAVTARSTFPSTASRAQTANLLGHRHEALQQAELHEPLEGTCGVGTDRVLDLIVLRPAGRDRVQHLPCELARFTFRCSSIDCMVRTAEPHRSTRSLEAPLRSQIARITLGSSGLTAASSGNSSSTSRIGSSFVTRTSVSRKSAQSWKVRSWANRWIKAVLPTCRRPQVSPMTVLPTDRVADR